MNRVLGFIVSVSAALYIIFSVPVLLLAGLLLAHGETHEGRLFAFAVILGLPAPVLMWLASHLKKKRNVLITATGLAGSCILLLGIDYGRTPRGVSLPESSAHSHFAGPSSYRRASMANMVPEMDQLILGSYVMPALDPLMDEPNTMEMRTQVREIYGEMRQAPEFECLGSVLNQTYDDLFLGRRSIGHFYEYLPKTATRESLPVVIFLHGSLGNFKGYMWVWKRIADENGFAIVAPTFGTGNWDHDGGVAAIELARQYCASHPRMDPSRIYLAGISNGGLGACLGASRSPDAYRGLILISPVLDQEALLTSQFVMAWKDKPILVIHGTVDNRVPLTYVKEAVRSVANAGIRVEVQFYDGQTHFLFFTIRDKVQVKIGNWLKNN